jgi:hypothetical protein
MPVPGVRRNPVEHQLCLRQPAVCVRLTWPELASVSLSVITSAGGLDLVKYQLLPCALPRVLAGCSKLRPLRRFHLSAFRTVH